MYTNINPMKLDSRLRIESNYTTRSGERLADVAEIGSVRSGGKKLTTSPAKKSIKEVSPKRKPKAGTMYVPKEQKDLLGGKPDHKQGLEINTGKVSHNRIGSQILSPKITTSKVNLNLTREPLSNRGSA